MASTSRALHVIAVISPVVLWPAVAPLMAQNSSSSSQPQSSQPQSGQKQSRQKRRPQPQPLRVQEVSDRLQRILEKWQRSSKQIRTLQGKHQRRVYDTVFNVEKRATGRFYYKAPDKGRIDIQPADVKGQKSRRTDQEGTPYKLEADRPEKWICNGKEILKINDREKTVEVYPIPAEARGKNIMRGPLPFLFGMPAEQAKRRFFLKLLKVTDKHVWLQAKPRWRQDAANYRKAKIILNRETFLPFAVKLIDPSGNLETVYIFDDLQVNEKPNLLQRFWQGNPFQPDLDGYKVVTKQPKNAKHASRSAQPEQTTGPKSQKSLPTNQPLMPSVKHYHWKKAQQIFEQAGFEVEFRRGQPAEHKELEYTVSQQQPPAKTPLEKDQTIILTLYDKMGGSKKETAGSE